MNIINVQWKAFLTNFMISTFRDEDLLVKEDFSKEFKCVK